jgi:hypothetical protein
MVVAIDIDSALGSLHCVDVGSVAKVSKVDAASIFRVKVIYYKNKLLISMHRIM